VTAHAAPSRAGRFGRARSARPAPRRQPRPAEPEAEERRSQPLRRPGGGAPARPPWPAAPQQGHLKPGRQRGRSSPLLAGSPGLAAPAVPRRTAAARAARGGSPGGRPPAPPPAPAPAPPHRDGGGSSSRREQRRRGDGRQRHGRQLGEPQRRSVAPGSFRKLAAAPSRRIESRRRGRRGRGRWGTGGSCRIARSAPANRRRGGGGVDRRCHGGPGRDGERKGHGGGGEALSAAKLFLMRSAGRTRESERRSAAAARTTATTTTAAAASNAAPPGANSNAPEPAPRRTPLARSEQVRNHCESAKAEGTEKRREDPLCCLPSGPSVSREVGEMIIMMSRPFQKKRKKRGDSDMTATHDGRAFCGCFLFGRKVRDSDGR
jgi:hypothetical protein